MSGADAKGTAIRLQGPGGRTCVLQLGFSGIEVVVNEEELGVVSPLLSQQLAQGILSRWPMRVERQPSVRLRARDGDEMVWEAIVPLGYPIPDNGEQVDYGSVRYAVRSRVWSYSGQGDIDATIDLHVEKMFARSERPELGHSPSCASRRGGLCNCRKGA